MTYSSYDASHRGADEYRRSSGLDARLADSRAAARLFGSQDELVDPNSAQDYEGAGARVVVSRASGHSPHVEQPGRDARLIARLRRRSSRALAGAAA